MEGDFMRSVLPVHGFHSEDSSLALPHADKLTYVDAHRLNRLQQQVQLTLSRKRKKLRETDSSLSRSLSSCHISSLGSMHVKRMVSVHHSSERSLPATGLSEQNRLPRSFGSFGSSRAGLCWGSSSFTLPTVPASNHFPRKQPLRYTRSEVLPSTRSYITGQSVFTQPLVNPVLKYDTDKDVFFPSTPHNVSAKHNRMDLEKHTLHRTLSRPREGGFGAYGQSENVSWQGHVRKPSLEFVAGRRPSQSSLLISLEETSGSLQTIQKSVDEHAFTVSTRKSRHGEVPAEMTLKEAVNLLTQENTEAQITAVNFIQNQCYSSLEAKRKVLYLQGIPKLVNLLQNGNEELQRAAVSALRNIAFENNENKMEVRDCEGLKVIINQLKTNRDIETRRQLAGLLWNLSSHDLLKEQLAKQAVRPLTDSVLVPCSGISEGEDPKLELLSDPDVFYNATGCLRNLSSSGPDGRKAMRDCEGLIECVIFYVRSAIADYKPDDKATENCVCILHNLSFRIGCEIPPVEHQPRKNHIEDASNPGCFILRSPKILPEEENPDFSLLEENGDPHGVKWLWSAITVRMYLSLIAVCTNQNTKEASVGALQNLTALPGEISQAIAHFIVKKEDGLFQVKRMLQEGNKEETRISVSLLKNLSRYKELHTDMVKQVFPELVVMLPKSDRSSEQPVEVTVAICHILINLSHPSAQNASAIISHGALSKIISISTKDNGYGPTRAGHAACVLLHGLWKHSELHSSFKKAGYKKSDFINNRTMKAVNSLRD